MNYTATLPLPGGSRETLMTVNSTSGSLTDPYTPESTCPLYDVQVTQTHMRLKAMVGRTEFVFDGPACPEGYMLSFTTHETIPLAPGKRLSGQTGALAGEYLVGVYSPGGVKENHFVIIQSPGGYTGEMYGLVDEKTLEFMASMGAGPGGGPSRPLPQLGDKMDENPFSSVTGKAEQFEVVTITGMGSKFRFTGRVEGDDILMTLHVTDSHSNILARRQP